MTTVDEPMQERPAVLRRATLSDAGGIARCFQNSYRQGYPYRLGEEDVVREGLQDPHRAVWVIEYNGDVVGTASALFAGGGRVELGRDCVHPDYRGLRDEQGRNVFGELLNTRIRHAFDRGAELVYVTTVSAHPRSQAAYVNRGFAPVCLEPGRWVDLFAIGQRETGFGMVHTGSPLLRNSGQNRAYIPAGAEPVVRFVQQATGCSRELARCGSSYTGASIQTAVDGISNYATVTLTKGNSTLREVVDEVQRLRENHACVQLEVAAKDGLSGPVCERLEREGLVYTGFRPGWIGREDALTMQTPTQLDTGKVHMVGPNRELAALVGYNRC